MARPKFLLACASVLLYFTCASAAVIEQTFHVEGVALRRLCKKQVVTAVNGSLPGPTIYATEGDSLVVHVLNKSPYNITIHWHGVTQFLNCWADGTEYISQCPIRPGNSYSYKFNVTGQEGTLWWHAHAGFQRVTIYGALIIYPRPHRTYPFPKPYKEVPIILGEWYNQNIVNLDKQLDVTGNGPNSSDAFTINGWPGDFYSCSSYRRRFLNVPRKLRYSTLKLPSNITGLEPTDIYKLKVTRGETYLLRIINAAVSTNQFFKIANHNLTVVAVDAVYTNPYPADVIVLAPGQTTDVLLIADQPPALYYMASVVYRTSKFSQSNSIPATGIIVYDDAIISVPKMPDLPEIFDTPTAYKFLSNLTGLVTGPFWAPVPREVDEHMFITVGLGIVPCEKNRKTRCQSLFNQRIAGSLNNVSFLLPTKLSILEAFYNRVEGIYTTDFPDEPPVKFDYPNETYTFDSILVWTEKATKVKQFKYNSTVEIVFQTHSLVTLEAHPMHIHGFNFYVLGQGFGIYDPLKDGSKLNFLNPHMRNTILVPTGGWTVIRFRADNPGAWYVHCHNEGHVPIGLAGAFIVENGPTPSTMLPSPPPDLPKC